jgi:hypothetical protein
LYANRNVVTAANWKNYNVVDTIYQLVLMWPTAKVLDLYKLHIQEHNFNSNNNNNNNNDKNNYNNYNNSKKKKSSYDLSCWPILIS